MSTELERIDEEELLLIISGLGMPQEPTPENPEPDYWVSDECRECLSDLQRYLRRDNPNTMAFHRALGGWRVVQAHLLPILAKSGHDPKLVFSVLKIVVKLTMKPEQLGARMVEHLAEKKTPDPLVGKQLDELRDHHRAYKRAFLRPIASVPNMDAMGVLVRILSTPVAKAEANRSDEDTMLIELTLALLLNLLHTAPPDAPPPVPGKDAAARQDSVVLRQLLQRMHEEHAIDLLLYILQSVEDSPSHRNWNLTLLEIMYYVLSSHTPAQIFGAAADAPPTGAAAADDADDADADADGGDGDGADGEAAAASPAAAPAAPARTPAGGAGGGGGKGRAATKSPKTELGSLLQDYKHSRAMMNPSNAPRHSRFGGAYKLHSAFGTTRRASDPGRLARAQPHTSLTPLLPPLQGDTSLTPNAFSWSSAIAACERAGEWQKGLAIFTALRDAGALTPSDKEDGALYNAAISAAASGGVVEVATDLLEEMLEAGASPHLTPLAAPPPHLLPRTPSLTACADPVSQAPRPTSSRTTLASRRANGAPTAPPR